MVEVDVDRADGRGRGVVVNSLLIWAHLLNLRLTFPFQQPLCLYPLHPIVSCQLDLPQEVLYLMRA